MNTASMLGIGIGVGMAVSSKRANEADERHEELLNALKRLQPGYREITPGPVYPDNLASRALAPENGPTLLRCDCGQEFKFNSFIYQNWNTCVKITCRRCGTVYRIKDGWAVNPAQEHNLIGAAANH